MVRVVFVYPGRGNVFYGQLAVRLAEAARELGRDADTMTFERLVESGESVRGATVGWVNPQECLLTTPRNLRRVPRFDGARRLLLVTAEAARSHWYRRNFLLPASFDAVLDVGFVSQAAEHGANNVPYVFLFNGWTVRERDAIAEQQPRARPVPWAVVGHRTLDRVQLSTQLAQDVDPGGVVFLSELRPVRADSQLLSPDALSALLHVTKYYVWRSHHEYDYYESFRFLDALMCGCMPAKIISRAARLPVPGLVPTAEALLTMRRDDAYDDARRWYLERPGLAKTLDTALAEVDG